MGRWKVIGEISPYGRLPGIEGTGQVLNSAKSLALRKFMFYADLQNVGVCIKFIYWTGGGVLDPRIPTFCNSGLR